MRCDLHVHSIASGIFTVPGLNRICRESYNDPSEVYDRLKQMSMSVVTITDHDSIDAAEILRCHPDFFLSEEEVRVAAQDLCGVDGVMIGYGDDGHAHLLQPVIDFTGVVVGLPANPIQPGDGEHSRGDRMNVKVTAHGANCLLSI